MMMNCDDIRTNMALWDGVDGRSAGQEEALVRNHLATCADCQAYRIRLSESLTALRTVAAQRVELARQVDLRDRVMRALPESASPNGPSRFNGWIPALALAASVLLMFGAVARVNPQPSAFDWGTAGRPVERNLFQTDPRFHRLPEADPWAMRANGVRSVSNPVRPLYEP
ncbi:MAG: zf-HC2 domain-containing protein [Planctomycetaceae bacterium]|jgi:anti-sigma factor RsiW|nr:zf-HC2 domain-containing protein [Planctomycetaceae bacterium]